jgi:chromosomal replication initiation ATPase DnaA
MGITKSQALVNTLLERTIITPEQYQQATKLQQKSGSALEDCLLELKILSEEDLVAVTREIFQMRFLKLEDVEIDRDAIRHIPAAIAHKYRLIPIRRSGNSLAVVMVDPMDEQAQAALRSVTDFEIISFIGREDAIEHALYIHYGQPKIEDPSETAETKTGASQLHSRLLNDDDRFGYIGKSIQINRLMTFDTMIEDTANQFALSVSRALVEPQSEEAYNPFCMWGKKGCGKTHLLHAMANHITTYTPLKRYILTSAKIVIDNLFESICENKLNLFRYFFREADFLMIDECDRFIGVDWVQREIADTFKDLGRKGKHMVLASRTNIVNHPRLIPELRDILQRGVVAGIGDYTSGGKLRILENRKRNLDISDAVLSYLVTQADGSVDDLLNVFKHVAVLAEQEGQAITNEVVDDLVQLCAQLNPPKAQRASDVASKWSSGGIGGQLTAKRDTAL